MQSKWKRNDYIAKHSSYIIYRNGWLQCFTYNNMAMVIGTDVMNDRHISTVNEELH